MPPSASVQVSPLLQIETTAIRSVTISGYVNTSIGQITTAVHQDMRFSDDLVPDILDLSIELIANSVVTTTITTVSPNGTSVEVKVDSYSVALKEGLPSMRGPLRLMTTFIVDQLFVHASTIVDAQGHLSLSSVKDGIHAENGGLTSERYVSDQGGLCWNHYLAVLQGFTVSDEVTTVCRT